MWKWNDGTTYLMHHGIKGQKWGVRNGPPYPIDHKVMAKGTRLNSVFGLDAGSLNSIIDYGFRTGKLNPSSSADDMASFVAELRKDKDFWLYTYNPDDEWDSDVYKGPFARYLQIAKGAQVVAEFQYETVKDLTMPTKQERIDEFSDLLNDKKFKSVVISDLENTKKMLIEHNVGSPEDIQAYKKIDFNNIKTKEDLMIAYNVFNHAMEAMHSHESTREYARRMASKWDAMVDDNNQGIYNRAHDPVIIFRAKEALKVVGGEFKTAAELVESYSKIENELRKLGERVAL